MKFTADRVICGDDSSSGRTIRSDFELVSAPDTWELLSDNFRFFSGLVTSDWRPSPNRFGCEKQNNIYSAQTKITADDFLRGLSICVSRLQAGAVVFRSGIGGRAEAGSGDGEESAFRVSGGAGVGVWVGVGVEAKLALQVEVNVGSVFGSASSEMRLISAFSSISLSRAIRTS